MKFAIKKSFINNGGNLKKNLVIFLKERLSLLIFLIFSSISFYSGYLWYTYVKNHNWSDSKKIEYIQNKPKETEFDKKKFAEIIRIMNERDANYVKEKLEINDIFRLKK